jgi:predicted N-acetyltransferase YhbS
MVIKIRPETASDYPAITEVNDLAFGQPAEGKTC